MTKDEQTIANLKKLKSVHNGSYGADIDRAIKAIEQASKTGHWIEPTLEMILNHTCGSCEVICSSCNEPAIDEYDYCPNCGAKMEVEE